MAIWAVSKRLSGSIYYLCAQLTYVVLILYNLFIVFGFIEASKYSWLGIHIYILSETIFLLFTLNIKIKEIEKKKIEAERLLITQSRFVSLGQSIASLVHQWKTPLARLGSQVSMLKAVSVINKKNFDETFLNTVPEMQESVEYLNYTINDIYNLYANPKEKENFSIK